MMKSTIFTFFCQVLILVSCLDEPIVTLSGDKGYINLNDPLHRTLHCDYSLKTNEGVTQVSWNFNRDLVFTWTSTEGAKAIGILEGNIILDRSDPHLEFASLFIESGGAYSCKVTTSLGETFQSPDYQLTVVDISNRGFSASSRVEDCQVLLSWDVPAITPKPTPRCGVWLDGHGFITTATNWKAVPYFNSSISYHLEDEPFKIVEMSLNSDLRCEVGIERPDNSFLQLNQHIYEVHEEVRIRGCAPVDVGDKIVLTYDNEMLSCRNEIIPKDPSLHAMAMTRCSEGTVPILRGGTLSEVKLYCADATWTLVQGFTWEDFDNFRCKDPSMIVAETFNNDKKESKQIIPGSAKTVGSNNDESMNSNGVKEVECCFYSIVLCLLVIARLFRS